MADKEQYNWEGISGSAVEKLRKPKITPVPEHIVKLAQRSYSGVPDPKHEGKLLHVLRHEFKPGDEKRRDEFARLMKKAGPHTKPETSVSVVVDPDNEGNVNLIAWRAGEKRGRKGGNGDTTPE